MDAISKSAIEKYQCVGCTNGCNISCYHSDQYNGITCTNHSAGTFVANIGRIFLGLPTGFNRAGMYDQMKPLIFKTYDSSNWVYNKFNIPVWKYKNEFGHTIVRGLSPRLNCPFLHIYLEDCTDKIDCFEITDLDIADMD